MWKGVPRTPPAVAGIDILMDMSLIDIDQFMAIALRAVPQGAKLTDLSIALGAGSPDRRQSAQSGRRTSSGRLLRSLTALVSEPIALHAAVSSRCVPLFSTGKTSNIDQFRPLQSQTPPTKIHSYASTSFQG